MPTCKCIVCNEEFRSKRNAKLCDKCRTRTCSVCGKTFSIDPSQLNKTTCSRKCKQQETQLIREGKLQGQLKICEYCGKPFYSNHNRRRYCYDDHYATCQVCGKRFKILHMDSIPATCSEECKQKYTISTVRQKYGVDYVFQDKKFKENAKKSSLIKYGLDNPAKSNTVKHKIENTFKEKYSGHPMKQSYIKDKFQNTMMKRYGVTSALQSDRLKSKMEATMIRRYGVSHALNDTELLDKVKKTNLDKFGVEYPAKSDEIKAKMKETSIDRYGVDNYKYLQMTDSSKYKLYREFKNDPIQFIEQLKHKPSISELCQICGVLDSAIGNVIHEHHIEDHINWKVYSLEEEVKQFIESISNTDIILHDRKVITPYELDILLPEFNLAIECNPTATHNSSIQDPWGGLPKDKYYHQFKSQLCKEQGIQLIHIFGYEWKYKQDVLKSILANKLLSNKNVYYARKLNVDDNVAFIESRQFLNQNHRQGSCVSSVRIGLRDTSGELVALMTFGKLRNSISKSSSSESLDVELLRFCTKLNTSVIGGCSKLFKHYTKNYNYSNIVSYSDFSHTSGSIYSTLGFKLDHLSKPGYMWVNVNTDQYLTRVSCQKQNILKLFPDKNLDLTETEDEIMTSLDYVKVYDSGSYKWIYK